MIRQFVQKVGWRLFALVAAWALWITFVASPDQVTSITAPVKFESMPSDLELSSELPQRIYVEVRGPAARLRQIDVSSAAVVVNLSPITGPCERTFTIDQHSVEVPAGVNVVRTVPSQLRLRFDRRLTVDVPVTVRFEGLAQGYRIAQQKVEPEKVRITGPESRVRQVDDVETDPINLAHAQGKAEFPVHTFFAEPQVRFVSSPVVHVSVTIEKATEGGAVSDGKTTVRN